MTDLTTDELMFFQAKPEALPLYAALAQEIKTRFPRVSVRVKKSQITFWERNGFAFVSLRRIKGCPKNFIIVSFGLAYRLDSPRVAVAVEPYPRRWTHHVIVGDAGEIDGELLGWIGEAHDFALLK